MGLVSQVFDESTLEALKGHLAVGHSRYSTTGASTWHNAQPTFRPTADGSIALGHNGNLTNTRELQQMVAELPRDAELGFDARKLETSTNDTSLVTALLAHHPDTSLEERAAELLPKLRGAFSFVWMDESTLYAARDPQGIRPLVLGPARARLGRRHARPRPSTSSARRTSARSSPARWSPSTSTACAPAASPRPSPRAASSSSSTSPGPTP